MVALCRLELLGGVHLYLGERCVSRFRTTKTVIMLAYIALQSEQRASRDSLAALIWPDLPDSDGRARLSVELSFLRGLATSAGISLFVADRQNVAIVPGMLTTDAVQFERLLRQSDREPDTAKRTALLTEALALYKGELLPGLYDDWAITEQGRLAARFEEAQLTASFLQERAQSKFAGVAPAKLAPPVPTALPAPVPENLPASRNLFIGRDKDLVRLRNLIGEHSLVTVTGTGGIGKTRLITELLPTLGNYRKIFVSLAPVAEGKRIPEAIADAFSLSTEQSGSLMEILPDALSTVSTLLVLDNAEHLLSIAAEIVDTLLQRASSLRCLVTSRERLEIAGEMVFPLEPLSLMPENGALSPAMHLFTERAQAVRSDFYLTEANTETVATLCRRLDGLPLAIELVASRAQILSPAKMLAALDDDPAQFRTRRQRAEKRHASLFATIDWSYCLLPTEAQIAFCRLSVFRGGFTADAAHMIAGTNNALLADLVAASLVVAKEVNGEMRFSLLETVLDFARHTLPQSELSPLQQAHAAYYSKFATTQDALLLGPHHEIAVAALHTERENILVALDTLTDNPSAYWKLVGDTGYLWFYYYLERDQKRLELALQPLPGVPGGVRAKVLEVLSRFYASQGHGDKGRAAIRLATQLYRDAQDTIGVIRALSYTNLPEAWEESLSLMSGLDTPVFEGMALSHRAGGLWREGQVEESQRLFARAVACMEHAGYVSGQVGVLIEWGYSLLWCGNYRQAVAMLERCLALLASVGQEKIATHPLWILGSARLESGDYAGAERDAGLAITGYPGYGPTPAFGSAHLIFGQALLYQGKFDESLQAFTKAKEIFEALEPGRSDLYVARRFAEWSLAQGKNEEALALLDGLFRRHWSAEQGEIATMDFGNAGFLTPIRALLAESERRCGLTADALSGFCDVLKFKQQSRLWAGSLRDVEGIAAICAERSETKRAILLLSAARTHRLRRGNPALPYQNDEWKRIFRPLQTSEHAPLWEEGQKLSFDEMVTLALTAQNAL